MADQGERASARARMSINIKQASKIDDWTSTRFSRSTTTISTTTRTRETSRRAGK
jgi:hypothetical protein